MSGITEVKDNIEIKFGDIYMSLPKKKEDMQMAAHLLRLATEYVFGPELPPPPLPATPATPAIAKKTITKKDVGVECKKNKKRPSYVDLMGNFRYKVDKENDTVTLIYLPSNTKLKFTYSWVKEVYDSLPEKFTVNDLWKKARETGVELTKQECAWLIRVFSHIDFDAEIKREGNKLVAIKMSSNGSVREENIKKMEVEKETIGTPWEVERD